MNHFYRIVLTLLLIPGLAAASGTKDSFDDKTMRDIGYFLSDFTECNFYNESREEVIVSDKRLLDFAYCHIIYDDRDSLITEVPECVQTEHDKCAHDFFRVSADKVARILKLYFAYDMKNFPSVHSYYYKNGFYYFPATGGEEQPLFVMARKVKKLDNGNLEVLASLYNGEVQIRPKTNDIHLVAVIRPQISETKNTWSMVSLKLMTDIKDIDFNPERDYSQFHPVRNPEFAGVWENEKDSRNSVEIIIDDTDELGNHTVISRHLLSDSKRIECTATGVLNSNADYIAMVEPQHCDFIETSNDGSPDRITATDPELTEVLLVNEEGKLVVPEPCAEQNESSVSMCAVSYRKIKQ